MLDGGYLDKRAQELDLGRGEALEKIQVVLDELYPGKARALSIKDDTLRVTTESAAVSSELRLRQVELVKKFNQAQTGKKLSKLIVQIRGN